MTQVDIAIDTRPDGWLTFPGGELQGQPPRSLCPACREEVSRAAAGVATATRSRALCFQCYRADAARQRALRAAGQLDTASVERFQTTLPFEPVNAMRLAVLKAERSEARVLEQQGAGRFAARCRQAQITARRALQQLVAGLGADGQSMRPTRAETSARLMAATHAAELQLPEAWLPFVVSR